MRKSILAVLLVMSMIVVLCAACGQTAPAEQLAVSESFERATAEPEATPEPAPEAEAEPEDTPEPEQEAGPEQEAEQEQQPEQEPEQPKSGNNNNDQPQGGDTTTKTTPEPAPTPEPAEERDPFDVANDLIGASVDELYDAIGRPHDSSYTASCMVIGSDDGYLYYDGFTVETIRHPDGSELVYDVF